MKAIETFTRATAGEFERYGLELAVAYKIAFAGEPWNERSRCDTRDCSTQMCASQPGLPCPVCGTALMPAYDEETLIQGWLAMLKDEEAFIEVALRSGTPYLATIARPTTQTELFERKYSDVLPMENWIKKVMPDGTFIWIEDTFANRDMQPSKNLSERGKTLGRIALEYGGLEIATRTLEPAIVAATIRDVGPNVRLYQGEKPLTMKQGYEIVPTGLVPDARTFISIDGAALL